MKFLINIYFIFIKIQKKYRIFDFGNKNFKGFIKILWFFEEGVIKFIIYGFFLFLLCIKFGINDFIKFRQEVENY